MYKILSVFCVCFILLGCSGKLVNADSNPTSSIKVDWKPLPDRSQFYVAQEGGATEIERCWPSGAEYSCIVLSKNNGGSIWMAERQNKRELKPTNHTYVGYSCSVDSNQPFGIEFQESISRSLGRDLLTNMSVKRPPAIQGWSREFIERFMAENGVDRPESWFNCAGLRQIVLSGSGETLTTTTTKREQLF